MKTETKVPSDKRRQEWVAMGHDGVEHRFVRCKHCHQPWQLQKVLRVSIEDYNALMKLSNRALQTSFWVAMALSFPFIVVISTLLLGLIQFSEPEIYYTIVQAALGTSLVIWSALRWNSQEFKEIKTIRNEILNRYGAKVEDYPLVLPPKSIYD